jgi:hypothetical protein
MFLEASRILQARGICWGKISDMSIRPSGSRDDYLTSLFSCFDSLDENLRQRAESVYSGVEQRYKHEEVIYHQLLIALCGGKLTINTLQIGGGQSFNTGFYKDIVDIVEDSDEDGMEGDGDEMGSEDGLEGDEDEMEDEEYDDQKEEDAREEDKEKEKATKNAWDIIYRDNDLDTRAAQMGQGRRVFVSESGHFGLVPDHAQVGDLVCILYGCDVPVILRKIKGHYELIGESYVHGIMKGEAMEAVQRLEAQDFNIY